MLGVSWCSDLPHWYVEGLLEDVQHKKKCCINALWT